MPPSYKTVAPALAVAAKRAARRYRAEYDDMLGEACLLYLRAVRAYRHGSFDAQLTVRLKRLADGPRRDTRRARLLARVAADLDRLPARDAREPLAHRLTPDAAVVASLAVRSRAGLTPSTIRRMVRDYLLATGWSPARIERAVTCIRQAIP